MVIFKQRLKCSYTTKAEKSIDNRASFDGSFPGMFRNLEKLVRSWGTQVKCEVYHLNPVILNPANKLGPSIVTNEIISCNPTFKGFTMF